jgi:hypothetical protein
MEGRATVTGMKEAVAAMQAAMPKDPIKQQKLLNQSMRSAAMQTILIAAKLNAASSDRSGALAASLGIRYQKKRAALSAGSVAGIYIAPIRHDPTAVARYISYYRANSANQVVDGIRHGHLVEFGHATRSGTFVSARPFLVPAASSHRGPYAAKFAKDLKRKIALAVNRKARKGGKRGGVRPLKAINTAVVTF